MSEYARRNLTCSSWHRVPEGWRSWSGMSRGWTTRPFCWDQAGHAGEHWAAIESTTETIKVEVTVHDMDPKSPTYGQTWKEPGTAPLSQRMTWPNTLGIPQWLLDTTKHGLAMLRQELAINAEGPGEITLQDADANIAADGALYGAIEYIERREEEPA